MPAIRKNETHLSELRGAVSAVKNGRQQVLSEQADNSIIPSSLDPYLKNWLDQLSNLYGVPFDNLIANEAMLPQESIRFFFIDQNWINSLLDGALSIGIQDSKDVELYQGENPIIKQETKLGRQRQRNTILGKPLRSEVAVGTVATGVLIRSEVVSGWPGLEVKAYSTVQNNEPSDQIQLLRMDRLSPEVMLCLFESTPKWIEVDEPKEGLHFGVGDDFAIQPRFLGGTNQATGEPATQEPSQYATAKLKDETHRVLDVLATINDADTGILAKLKALNVSLPSTGFGAAAFAVEMISTAEQAVYSVENGQLKTK